MTDREQGELARALLADGSALTVEVAPPGIRVRRVRGEEVLRSHDLPYPAGGLGGCEIVLSPSQRFAVLSFYSGQSEEGFQLLRIENFEISIDQDFVFGEVASYGFSPDETVLVMALPRAREWWEAWEVESEPTDDGHVSFEICELRVAHVEAGSVSAHVVQAVVRSDWEPKRDDWDSNLRPAFTSAREFRLALPWGPANLALPLPSVVRLPVP